MKNQTYQHLEIEGTVIIKSTIAKQHYTEMACDAIRQEKCSIQKDRPLAAIFDNANEYLDKGKAFWHKNL